MSKLMSDVFQILALVFIFLIGVVAGGVYERKSNHPNLVIVAQNSGVCGHCGETTVVTIRETRR